MLHCSSAARNDLFIMPIIIRMQIAYGTDILAHQRLYKYNLLIRDCNCDATMSSLNKYGRPHLRPLNNAPEIQFR